jgi:hypothetical protein
MSGKAEGVYLTLNPAFSDLLARGSNKLVRYAKHATSDEQVLRLHWLLLDFDPIRPAGISSTDAEHEAALHRARECREWLRTQGWPAPVFADSGNGGHLAFRVDLENNNDSTETLKSGLLVLGLQFSDSVVQVDPNTYNAARIVKLWGTLAAKGDNLSERPHRLSRLLDVPAVLEPVSVESLVDLARHLPKAEPQAQARPSRSNGQGFDLDRWIADHNLDVDGPTDWQGGRRWILRVCPWNPNHRGSAYIVQLPNGAVAAGCLHKSCAHKDWHALRDLVEPGWRNHSAQYREGVWAETNLPFQTAEELAAEAPAKVTWIAEPWVASGSITELAGKIKSAGKTTWITHLVRKVLEGEPFQGEPTLKTPVVYLTEQPRTSFEVALKRAGLLGRPDLIVLFWHKVIGLPWHVIAHGAIEECKRRGARLLIVDTGPQFAQLSGDAENNSGDALKATQPLQEAAAAGIGVIVVRHERKSGGDVGDSGRGSSAFGGAVDIVLSIRRAEGNSRPTLRVIRALSRFSETPDELVIDLTPGGYVSLGQTKAVEAQEGEASILSAAPTEECDAVPLDDLVKATGVKRATGQRAVTTLCSKGQLARVGGGKRGNPYRYWAPRIDSAQTTPPNGQKESCEIETEVL